MNRVPRKSYENDSDCYQHSGSCDDSGDCGNKVLGVFLLFWDTKTKTCTVADKKPKTKTLKIVGDATYRTQAEAENGMKIIKVCIRK